MHLCFLCSILAYQPQFRQRWKCRFLVRGLIQPQPIRRYFRIYLIHGRLQKNRAIQLRSPESLALRRHHMFDSVTGPLQYWHHNQPQSR